MEHLKWLESVGMSSLVNDNVLRVKSILKSSLNVKDEDVLIVTDKGFSGFNMAGVLAGCYYKACNELGLNAKVVVQTPKYRGQEADEVVKESLLELKDQSIVMMALSGRLGKLGRKIGSSYRKFTKSHGHKFISAPSLGVISNLKSDVLFNTLDVDYKEMWVTGQYLKRILDGGKEVRVVTDLGTDLTYRIDSRTSISNDGRYWEYGQGGNLPAGEVYVAPRGKKRVEGKIVVDGSLAHSKGSKILSNPVTLTVKQGKVVNAVGDDASLLVKSFIEAEKRSRFPQGVRRVCELGIGINRNASLIGSTIIDEKIYGTAHVATGSNYWFGGDIYAIVHFDQVFRNARIYVDGELIKY